MIMLLKLHSSLLIITVLLFSAMVISKPTSRNHRRHDAKLAAAGKNLKPLKQFNIRQQPTKRTDISFNPKPSNKPYIPIPSTGDVKVPPIQNPSDASKNLPGLGSITSALINGNSKNTASSLDDLIDQISKDSFGSSKLGNGFSDTKVDTKLPKVGSDDDPAHGSINLNPLKDKNDKDGKLSYVAGSDLGSFDHSLDAQSRRDEVDASMDGTDGKIYIPSMNRK